MIADAPQPWEDAPEDTLDGVPRRVGGAEVFIEARRLTLEMWGWCTVAGLGAVLFGIVVGLEPMNAHLTGSALGDILLTSAAAVACVATFVVTTPTRRAIGKHEAFVTRNGITSEVWPGWTVLVTAYALIPVAMALLLATAVLFADTQVDGRYDATASVLGPIVSG